MEKLHKLFSTKKEIITNKIDPLVIQNLPYLLIKKMEYDIPVDFLDIDIVVWDNLVNIVNRQRKV